MIDLSLRLLRARRGARNIEAPDPERSIPYSSAPFISGDTFRGFAGAEIAGTEVRTYNGLDTRMLFASSETSVQRDFVRRAEMTANRFDARTLIIHNGDLLPSKADLKSLGGIFERVFCVNLVNEEVNIFSLPIGLENANRRNNGRLSYYFEGLQAPREASRPRLVLSSFHTSTNPVEREPVEALFARSRFGFDGHHWKRLEYRRVLADSCFVISPPGNGVDCHRTWEAIYMGAVPVVLRDRLAASLAEDMPILCVDSYEEILDLSDDQLRAKYDALVKLTPQKAFSNYWAKQLFGQES